MTTRPSHPGRGAAAAVALLALLACDRTAPGEAPLRVAPEAPLPASGAEERPPPPEEPPSAGAIPAGGLATLVASLPGRTAVAPRPSLPDPSGRRAPGEQDPKPFVPRLTGRTPDGAAVLEFPLAHTRVVVQVSGNVARVEVTQFFVNPSPDRLEAIYAFPLPPNAAVTDMMFRIGSRVVLSEVRRRDEARRTYEAARKEGRTAALTEQERPNLFTQSVANVASDAAGNVSRRSVPLAVRGDPSRRPGPVAASLGGAVAFAAVLVLSIVAGALLRRRRRARPLRTTLLAGSIERPRDR
ncbi:MAG TPA: VIT domain-containing protein [Anaeromyxobacter sp.]|nr:VIT domain-containing protein [Anaeromyxobacter sp.]